MIKTRFFNPEVTESGEVNSPSDLSKHHARFVSALDSLGDKASLMMSYVVQDYIEAVVSDIKPMTNPSGEIRGNVTEIWSSAETELRSQEIEGILITIYEYWETNGHLRFGQVIDAITKILDENKSGAHLALFLAEDEEIKAAIESLL